MMRLTARPILNIGCSNIQTVCPRRSLLFVIYERIYWCIRPYFMKALKNLLSTTFAHEPIVN